MERARLESAAATYSHLRGLLQVPFGVLLIVAALGNWQWGPFRHAAVFGVCLAAAGLAALAITRYYGDRYGRIATSGAQQARTTVATVVGVGLLVGSALLLRSRASWSLDLPVNPTAVSLAVFMLAYYAIVVGLRRHHAVIWGAVLVAGLLPLWGGTALDTTGNVGLVIAGAAAILTGLFDHRELVRAFAPPGAMLPGGDARA